MAHVRQQVRDAAVTALTGLAPTGSNVFKARPHSIPEARLPCLQLVTTDEESEIHAKGSDPTLLRECGLQVAIRVQGEEDTLQDDLDAIAVEVEAAVAADATFGGLVLSVNLTGSAPIYDGDGAMVAGVLVLTFAVRYRTSRSDPETSI